MLKQWRLDGIYQETINTGELLMGMYFLALEHHGAQGIQCVIKQ